MQAKNVDMPMPMYDFSCQDCAAAFEELLVKKDDAVVCPKCGSTAILRMISAPSPLKTGNFPFKPGPVHPMAGRMAGSCGGACPRGGACPGGGAFA